MTTVTLVRHWLTPKSTIGELALGSFRCYTLEDQVRHGEKVPGKTAIPTGTYPLRITWSPRFKRPMPIVEDVPGFTGIRIHSGNWPEDTEGCILLGRQRGEDAIFESRPAVAAFERELEAALRRGPAQIVITQAAETEAG